MLVLLIAIVSVSVVNSAPTETTVSNGQTIRLVSSPDKNAFNCAKPGQFDCTWDAIFQRLCGLHIAQMPPPAVHPGYGEASMVYSDRGEEVLAWVGHLTGTVSTDTYVCLKSGKSVTLADGQLRRVMESGSTSADLPPELR